MAWDEAKKMKLKTMPGALICRECFEPVPLSDKARFSKQGLCIACEESRARVRQSILDQEYEIKREREQ